LAAPSDSLEKHERTALLRGLGEGSGRAGGAADQRWVRHDFRRAAENLGSSDISQLHNDHHRFTTLAASKLGLLLRERVELDSARVEVSSYAEFTRGLPDPASLYLVHSKTLGAQFLMSIAPRVLLWMIERLLGAPSSTSPPPDRGLTRLEESLARTVLKRLLEALDETWRNGETLGLEVLESEQNPLLLQVQGPDSPVVRMTCTLSIPDSSIPPNASIPDGARLEGDLSLVLPQGQLLSYLSGAGRRRSATDGTLATDRPGQGPDGTLQEAEKILGRLDVLEVDVTVDLATRALALRSLVGLQPGDIVDTGVSVEQPVDIRIAGHKVARGTAGDNDGKLGVRVH